MKTPEIVTLLIEAGADANGKEKGFYRTPLCEAVMSSPDRYRLEKITLLIEAGADVNKKGRSDFTALMYAALFSSPEIVTVLIEAGADVNAKSDDGSTPLMFTASGKRDNLAPESVKLLIEAGADVNAKSDDGSTPLMVASGAWHPEVVTLLIEKGADVNAKDTAGKTSLMFAAGTQIITARFGSGGVWEAQADSERKGARRIVDLLIDKGADVNSSDNDGRTPLDYVADNHWLKYDGDRIIRALKAAGARE
jgi:ankyrin repeat protein